MLLYWLSRNGSGAVEGPFEEGQLLAMWSAGAVTARRAQFQGGRKPVKSEGLGLVLSILFTGAGHMYAGEVWQGMLILLLTVVMGLVFWPLAVLLWLLVLIDAPRAVRRWNERAWWRQLR